ncbi:MAG: hypothetical protein LBO74_15495 [Candidatus Symbiothrix sp.]|nr:hypothetical protein [Candidatus Symbiothrix sp.]
MKKNLFLALILLIVGTASMNAQVNIGSIDDPKGGALLDLSQSGKNLGLILPNVPLANTGDWQLDEGDGSDHEGTVVFNTNAGLTDAKGTNLGKGIFVWNGKAWMATKSGTGAVLALDFTLTPNGTIDIWEGGTRTFSVSDFIPTSDQVAKGVKWVLPADYASTAIIQSNTVTACVVKGLTPGTAVLTVTSADGNVEKTVTIHVLEVNLLSFDLDKTALTLVAGGTAGTITASNFIGSDGEPFPGDAQVTWTLTGSTGNSTVTEGEATYTVDPSNEEEDATWTITASAGGVTKNPVTVSVIKWPEALLLPNAAMDYSTTALGDVAKDWTNPSNTVLAGAAYGANPAGVAAGKSLMVSQLVPGKTQDVVCPMPSTDANLNSCVMPAQNYDFTWAEGVSRCANSVEGGFDDWYAPNYMELKILYNSYLAATNDGRVHMMSSTESSASTAPRLCATCPGSYVHVIIGKDGPDINAPRCVRRY